MLDTPRRIKIDAYTIDVRRNDKNGVQPVVLIHGIGASGRYFLPYAHMLAKFYDVHIIDLPGYGRTPRPDHALTIIELAEIVTSYVHAQLSQPPIIIGHSMGCQVAARAVEVSPMLYKKMILLGPTANRHERSIWRQAVRLLQDTRRETVRVNGIIFRDYIRMGVVRYLQTCRYMVNDKIEQRLPLCPLPTLIVRGERDKIVPSHWTEYLVKQLPNGAVAEIYRAPHVIQFHYASDLMRISQGFIEL